MSIFDIDWNNDGKVDFQDTVLDLMLIEEMEHEEKDSFDDFDDV